jgi:hypothetical protein
MEKAQTDIFRQRKYIKLLHMLHELSQSDRENCEIVLLCANRFRLFQVTELLFGEEVSVSAVGIIRFTM